MGDVSIWEESVQKLQCSYKDLHQENRFCMLRLLFAQVWCQNQVWVNKREQTHLLKISHYNQE